MRPRVIVLSAGTQLPARLLLLAPAFPFCPLVLHPRFVSISLLLYISNLKLLQRNVSLVAPVFLDDLLYLIGSPFLILIALSA